MKKSISLELRYQSLSNSHYCVTSVRTEAYNCIAWAAGENHRLWWPIPYQGPYYWPEDADDDSLEVFISGFERLRYVVCESKDLEEGFEKVAIYVDQDGLPSHMAKQLECGLWTSKCGGLEDISHTLEGLEGPEGYGYGTVACVMKRPLDSTPTTS